ncbi:hypothetical protein [Piscinibacter defluvii]|uniref:hypothetical protein n=1 Tax=Piscinibacter defluvii TaxID=1796922 RepID=UPI000FDD52EC|nr:hypothetical protein [Piscinibacter defluvii]
MKTAVVASLAVLAVAAAAAAEVWTVAGRQGLVQLVIVPTGQAPERHAYDAQIARLCEPDRTCFLNFYTNSTGAPVELPLPDAIAQEATAIFRRSSKQQAELFRWSCRLQVARDECF